MKDYLQTIKNSLNHLSKGGKIIFSSKCRGKKMKELDVQELINMNYKVLLLLGYATSMASGYLNLDAYHDDSDKCRWFIDAVQAVVYDNKPLPPLP